VVKQTLITVVCDMPHTKNDEAADDAKTFELGEGKNRWQIDLCVKHAKPVVAMIANGRRIKR
jgi:hypothetical protein